MKKLTLIFIALIFALIAVGQPATLIEYPYVVKHMSNKDQIFTATVGKYFVGYSTISQGDSVLYYSTSGTPAGLGTYASPLPIDSINTLRSNGKKVLARIKRGDTYGTITIADSNIVVCSYSTVNTTAKPIVNYIDYNGKANIEVKNIDLTYNGYYFVNNSGSDSNNGATPETAWQTIAKVNASTFAPGDQILFERNDVWSEQLTVPSSGTSGNPIVYGAYGTGDKPKIYGSEAITGWTLHSGNIYKATFNTVINQLFLNDAKMKAARYPNMGYDLIETVNSTTSFTSNELDAGIDYTGATCFIRSGSYATVTLTVQSSSSKTITLPSVPFGSLNVNEGFVLINKLEFLDSAGEWFYDSGTSTVYLWTPAGDSPANYTVRGSVYDYGVVASSKNYVTIKDLELKQHKTRGITASGSNIIIDNNTVNYADSRGIYISSGSGHTISNNTVNHCVQNGIELYGSSSTISGNNVNNTFLFDEVGIAGLASWYMGSAIMVTGANNEINYNSIVNSGYNGIHFGQVNSVQHNYISNVGLTKNDGGSIYTSSADIYPNSTTNGSVISYNIIDGSYGNVDGYPGTAGFHGIYLDESAGYVTVEHNTIANIGSSAIFAHNGYNHTIRYNTTYRSKQGIAVNRDGTDINISNNIVYAFSRNIGDTQSERLTYQDNIESQPTWNNNTYINHYKSADIFATSYSTFTDFAGWKTATSQDAASTLDIDALPTNHAENILYNETLVSKTFYLNNATNIVDIDSVSISENIVLLPDSSKIITGLNVDCVLDYSDAVAPAITAFTIPATSTTVTVPITTFTTDSDVTKYLLNESATTPALADAGWTTTIPTEYIFSSTGTKTLYAWVRDEAGNISASVSDGVEITISYPTANVINLWEFNETSDTIVYDGVGSIDGANSNATIVNGKMNKALEFNGTTSIVKYTIPTILTTSMPNDFSFFMWHKRNGSQTLRYLLNATAGLTNYFNIGYSNSKLIAQVQDAGTAFAKITTDVIPDATWVFIAVTWNATSQTTKLYINGVEQTTTIGNSFGAGTNGFMSIGAKYTDSGYLIGQIDQTMFLNKECTLEEIQAVYAAGNGAEFSTW